MTNSKSTLRQMQRQAGIIFLALTITTGLSGCLVEKKDLEKIARTTDNLRVYQPGDYIIYHVTATRVPNLGGIPEVLSGSLRIDWNLHPDLIVPFTGDSTIPVIQEVSTMNLNGGPTNEGTTRYISQDANNGQVTLHAIEATGSEEHFWLNSDGSLAPPTLGFFTVFNSPITFGDQDFDGNPNIDFRVLQGCEGNSSCSADVGRFIDNHDVVGDSDEISTNLGVFINPYRINFSGSSSPLTPDFPGIDIRDLCGGTDYSVTHSGTMYILPEVGMIQMQNNCIDSNPNGYSMYYTITISSTNINLP